MPPTSRTVEHGDPDQAYPVTPLGFAVDVQPGPDGHSWCRVQISSIGISATFVFPHEYAESVIENLAAGIRAAAKKILTAGGESVEMPDSLTAQARVDQVFRDRRN